LEKTSDAVVIQSVLTLPTSVAGLEDDLYSVSGETDYANLSPSPLVPNFPSSQLVPKVFTENQVNFCIWFQYLLILLDDLEIEYVSQGLCKALLFGRKRVTARRKFDYAIECFYA